MLDKATGVFFRVKYAFEGSAPMFVVMMIAAILNAVCPVRGELAYLSHILNILMFILAAITLSSVAKKYSQETKFYNDVLADVKNAGADVKLSYDNPYVEAAYIYTLAHNQMTNQCAAKNRTFLVARSVTQIVFAGYAVAIVNILLNLF